ncbi:MAG: hypothetical protein R3B54_06225 [Bdellovibrionota bacterium]
MVTPNGFFALTPAGYAYQRVRNSQGQLVSDEGQITTPAGVPLTDPIWNAYADAYGRLVVETTTPPTEPNVIYHWYAYTTPRAVPIAGTTQDTRPPAKILVASPGQYENEYGITTGETDEATGDRVVRVEAHEAGQFSVGAVFWSGIGAGRAAVRLWGRKIGNGPDQDVAVVDVIAYSSGPEFVHVFAQKTIKLSDFGFVAGQSESWDRQATISLDFITDVSWIPGLKFVRVRYLGPESNASIRHETTSVYYYPHPTN